jgi:XRE family aerobic/anaerobic benzoate catabolism transcriptional regulator
MTRKALAHHADISERYLAQLEGGDGNCSIVLLRRIARAIGVPVTKIVAEQDDVPIETTLLMKVFERLPPQSAKDARDMILQRFGDSIGHVQRDRIALIGLRGGGKSTVGFQLAKKLGSRFIELDREAERYAGASLEKLFDMFGQVTFRRVEFEALNDILQNNKKFVLAAGGGIVTEPETFERLLSSCLTIWVRTEPAEYMRRVIAQGDMRPMASNPRAMDDLNAILQSRTSLYAKADYTLDTTGKSPKQCVAELMTYLDRAN